MTLTADVVEVSLLYNESHIAKLEIPEHFQLVIMSSTEK